jgi:hypothetical protein
MDIRSVVKPRTASSSLLALLLVIGVAVAALGGAPLPASASPSAGAGPVTHAAVVGSKSTKKADAGATAEKKVSAKKKSTRKKPAKKKKKKAKKKRPPKKKPTPAAAPTPPTPPTYGTPMVGTFKIDPGAFSAATGPTGSYLRMILAGGSLAGGPYFNNLFSGSADTTYTLISPGTDGGLTTGAYQPAPNPAFGGLLNSALANRIMAPQAFEGIAFSMSTDPVDPQSGLAVIPPAINYLNGKLNGEVAAVSAEWSGNYFNQGTPKPDGSTPGITQPVTGTYDPTTGAYVLEWASTIVGGPFNSFAGFWHLAGTFVPSS